MLGAVSCISTKLFICNSLSFGFLILVHNTVAQSMHLTMFLILVHNTVARSMHVTMFLILVHNVTLKYCSTINACNNDFIYGHIKRINTEISCGVAGRG